MTRHVADSTTTTSNHFHQNTDVDQDSNRHVTGRHTPIPQPNPTSLRSHIQHCKINSLQSIDDSVLLGLYHWDQSSGAAETVARHQEMATANISKARSIVDKVPPLESKRTAVQERLLRLKSLDEEWQRVERDMFQALGPYTTPALQSRLARAAHESETASDALLASFLSEGNVTDFLTAYRKERKLFHLRKERLDRWHEDRVRYM